MRFLFALFFLTFFSAAQAQQIIFEENFTSGIPTTWYRFDADGLIPATAVDTFDNAWIPFIHNGDTCAASTSYYTPSGQSADFLLSPRITLDAFSKLVWSARSFDASFPDGYIVMISTDSILVNFTDTIFVQNAENFYWQTRSVHLDLEGYASEDVFILFKNNTTDGFVLMLDDVKVLGSDFARTEEHDLVLFTVYPNPTSDFIHIRNFEPGSLVQLHSMTGQLLHTGYEPAVDVSSFPSGTYLLSVTSGNTVWKQTVARN